MKLMKKRALRNEIHVIKVKDVLQEYLKVMAEKPSRKV